jgi:tape measure domain
VAGRNAIDIVVNATDRASGKLQGIAKNLEGIRQRAERAEAIVKSAMAAMSTALAGVTFAGFKFNAILEQSQAKWTTLLGSQQKAIEQLKWIQNYAKSSPFDFEGVDKAATTMMGMGISLKNVREWLPILGDVAAVLGGGTETIEGIARALGQMNAKGKVSAEEMEQLAERGVSAWQFLADGMGLTVGQVRKLSEEGKLLSKDALPLIIEGMKKTFGGGTQNYMKSTIGQAEQAVENFKQLAGQLTNEVYVWFGANVLPLINAGLEKLQNIFSGGLLAGFEKLFNSKYAVAILAIAGAITGVLIAGLVSIAPAVASAVAAFAPFLAIGMAVAGLAYLIIRYWEPLKTWFINTFGGLFNIFANFFNGIWTLVQPVLSQVVTFISQKLTELKTFWSENWDTIKQATQNVWNAIKFVIDVALKIILAIFRVVWPIIKLVVLSTWEGIKTIIDGALKFIMGIIQFFSGLFSGNWSKMWEGIKNIVSGALQFLWGLFSTFFIGRFVGVIGKFAATGLKHIVNFASKGINAIVKFVTNVASKFASMVSKVISIVTNWARTIVSKIDSFVTSGINKIKSFNSTLGNLFEKGWNALKSIVKSAIDNTLSVIKGMGNAFLNAGRGLIDAFTNGIKNAFGKAVSAVKDGIAKIRKLLPFSPAKEGPLSDLDKSGESFFVTWYEGALKQVPAMTRAIGSALQALNNELVNGYNTVGLSYFGRAGRQVVVVRHEHYGEVEVRGETSREVIRFVGESVQEFASGDIFRDLRQAIRRR